MQLATVEHILPGRIRLRFPGQRGDRPFFEQLVSAVSQFPAVEEARANPVTGSLLIRHSGPPEDLAQAAVHLGLISPETLAALNSQTSSPTVRGAMLASTLPQLPVIALAGFGAMQLLRGRALGPASEHIWQARELWRRGMPQAAITLALLGVLQLSRKNILGSATSLLAYGLMLQNGWRRR